MSARVQHFFPDFLSHVVFFFFHFSFAEIVINREEQLADRESVF